MKKILAIFAVAMIFAASGCSIMTSVSGINEKGEFYVTYEKPLQWISPSDTVVVKCSEKENQCQTLKIN